MSPPKAVRTGVEVVGQETATSNGTIRIVREGVEVVGQETVTSTPNPKINRAGVEVVGQETTTSNALPKVSRVGVDVVSSSARLGQGLNLPGLTVPRYTLFMCIRPQNWSAGSKHEFAMIAGRPGFGVFLRQTETANQLEVFIRTGFNSMSSGVVTVAETNAIQILSVQQDTTTNATIVRLNSVIVGMSEPTEPHEAPNFTNLGGVIEDERQQNALVLQTLLYASLVSSLNIEAVEDYLYCKWVTPGASEANNFCVPA